MGNGSTNPRLKYFLEKQRCVLNKTIPSLALSSGIMELLLSLRDGLAKRSNLYGLVLLRS